LLVRGWRDLEEFGWYLFLSLTYTFKIMERRDIRCKVVWEFRGYHEEIGQMSNQSRSLCKWWVKEHKRDSQYASGTFKIVPIIP